MGNVQDRGLGTRSKVRLGRFDCCLLRGRTAWEIRCCKGRSEAQNAVFGSGQAAPMNSVDSAERLDGKGGDTNRPPEVLAGQRTR